MSRTTSLGGEAGDCVCAGKEWDRMANSHGKCNTDMEETSRVRSGSLELFKDIRLRNARDVAQPSYHGATKCHLPNAIPGLFGRRDCPLHRLPSSHRRPRVPTQRQRTDTSHLRSDITGGPSAALLLRPSLWPVSNLDTGHTRRSGKYIQETMPSAPMCNADIGWPAAGCPTGSKNMVWSWVWLGPGPASSASS